jgi:hypothetical protein
MVGYLTRNSCFFFEGDTSKHATGGINGNRRQHQTKAQAVTATPHHTARKTGRAHRARNETHENKPTANATKGKRSCATTPQGKSQSNNDQRGPTRTKATHDTRIQRNPADTVEAQRKGPQGLTNSAQTPKRTRNLGAPHACTKKQRHRTAQTRTQHTRRARRNDKQTREAKQKRKA